jgi:hypothetical protein
MSSSRPLPSVARFTVFVLILLSSALFSTPRVPEKSDSQSTSTDEERWRFATEEAIASSPAVADGAVERVWQSDGGNDLLAYLPSGSPVREPVHRDGTSGQSDMRIALRDTAKLARRGVHWAGAMRGATQCVNTN